MLSLLTIGLGHVYAGAARKGILLFFIPQFIFFCALVSLLLLVPNTFGITASMAVVAVYFGFYLYCVVDAVRIANRGRSDYALKNYNRWYIYILCWILASFVLQPALSGTTKATLLQAYRMPSGSMTPGLEIGDYFLVKKKWLVGSSIDRGDIVVFPYPEDPGKKFTKRVVGLGGESMEIRDKQVFIDGVPLEEPYKVHVDTTIMPREFNPRDNLAPTLIPEDALFLMGDNRDESNDSRFFGFVKKAAVEGKVYLIYWSWDMHKFGVRWDRIGKRL